MRRNGKDGERSEHLYALPKLRFPGFQERWEESPMSQLYSFKGNNSFSRDKLNYESGSLRNIHYGDIHTKFAPLFRVDEEQVPYINDGEIHSTAKPENYCAVGDMVFADASEDTDDIGKAIEIIEAGDVPLVAGLHTILARPVAGKMAVGFGAYLFASPEIRAQIQREAQGAKVLGLSASRLGAIRLAHPCGQKEQKKIVASLSFLDACIGAETRKLDALKAHKQGLMQQLFPAEGKHMPRLRFPSFEGEWEEKSLGEAATFYNGRSFKQDELLEEGRYRVLRVGNFFTNDHWYFSDLELDETKYCDSGDLLYAWSASFGPRRWVGEKVIYHYHIWKVVAAEDVDKDYLFFLLEFETERMKAKSANGLGLMHVTKGAIEAWQCRFPGQLEQQRIAACLTCLNDLISAQERQIGALLNHKRGLMQGLFPVTESPIS